MHKIFKRKQLFTIPNLLSFIRILLIPVIIWLYCIKKDYYMSVALILISGATDVVDGFIARRFNMTSDFGKILDPIADKLTQGAVIVCLAAKYRLIYALIAVFVIKEAIMLVFGYLAIKKKDSVNSAKWYGKAATVILYSVMLILILFPNIPPIAANALIAACIIAIAFSLIMYARFYIKLLGDNKKC